MERKFISNDAEVFCICILLVLFMVRVFIPNNLYMLMRFIRKFHHRRAHVFIHKNLANLQLNEAEDNSPLLRHRIVVQSAKLSSLLTEPEPIGDGVVRVRAATAMV